MSEVDRIMDEVYFEKRPQGEGEQANWYRPSGFPNGGVLEFKPEFAGSFSRLGVYKGIDTRKVRRIGHQRRRSPCAKF